MNGTFNSHQQRRQPGGCAAGAGLSHRPRHERYAEPAGHRERHSRRPAGFAEERKAGGSQIRLQPRDLKVDPADSGVCPHHGRETLCALANHGHAVLQDRSSEKGSLRLVLPQVGVAEPKEKQRSGKQRDEHDDQIRPGAGRAARFIDRSRAWRGGAGSIR